MNRSLILIATILWPLMVRPQVVVAQFENPPKDVLKLARDAAVAVKGARYSAEFVGSGWIAKRVPRVHGTVMVGEPSKWEIGQFRSEVTIIPQEEEKGEPIELTAGCDGETYFLIDKKTKTVHADMDPAVMGAHARDVQRVVLNVLGAPKPYEEEFEAKDLAIKSIPEVEGERCFEMHATVDGREVVWYIALKDYLPRRVERMYKNPEGEEGKTQLTLKDLEVNPEFAGSPFKAEVPEGFKKTDDFAP